MKKAFGALVLGTMFLFCRETKLTPDEVGFRDISPVEAVELIKAGKVLVLDVRTVDEYREGHITPSLLVPYDEVENRREEISAYGLPILVYCRSGRRSAIAAEKLTNMGFREVYNLVGGKEALLSYLEEHPEYEGIWCTKGCPGVCGYGRPEGGCGCRGTIGR